ncbi:hypothetical protein [Actibacterium sp. 188UL27-1]|uniref:hypothetical protein n=1 Tax=Actibacterium sp. 188UL27-1 TaxID=2786961 RepID=UPI00195D57DB|nr:hypothetical protein [Actibacterium sp. 188UL27-1]MBM7066049.1 hypothetical protein [Actibacterium sp. 188UL27-1]
MTIEILLSLTAVSLSILAVGGITNALWATREENPAVNLDDTIRRAPYHRLHNIVAVERG